jgi:preprotein translocase subunit SecD
MTGSDLKSAIAATDDLGAYIIHFELTPEGAKVFGDHTSANVNKFLTIVLDKQVISSPQIQGAITEGNGLIQGQFTYDEVNDLAIKLRYGSLPIPLKILETRIIGPTLGEDSLRKSLIAGAIGMLAVFTFMALFYRFPGFIAIIGIIFYALIAFAIFKYIPVTLTLAGIAGFLLSTGAALDANRRSIHQPRAVITDAAVEYDFARIQQGHAQIVPRARCPHRHGFTFLQEPPDLGVDLPDGASFAG